MQNKKPSVGGSMDIFLNYTISAWAKEIRGLSDFPRHNDRVFEVLANILQSQMFWPPVLKRFLDSYL